jgi:plastocyanin
LAKKKTTKKSVVKSVNSASSDHNSFIMILGGGFVVVMVILFLMGNPGTLMPSQNRSMSETEETVPVETTEVMEHALAIKDYAYSEQTITVKVGEKVTWTNNDTVAHTATADDGSFDTGMIEPGQSGSVAFDTAGTYTYHCTPHPNMTATIVVEE